MESYDHRKIEQKWQARWEAEEPNRVTEDAAKKKFYALIEFPYPSGEGLHVGHIRSNTAMDIIARKRRREGYNVLYPIGWDAFGLPTENYAIKTGIQPAIVTKQNTDTFRRQLKALGFSFDWSREINTTDPEYYKWTQWIFLQFFKKGLAYKKKTQINWCPKCLIGLANEEVLPAGRQGFAGACERCGTPVEKREKEQWMLAITKYADRLDKDLDEVDYREDIKVQQRHWIGRSEGAEISFKLVAGSEKLQTPNSTLQAIKVFTTRPDTIFGVTFVAISTELAKKLNLEVELPSGREEEKLGVDTGLKAINPATGEAVPVWITNYVLDDVGTGAVMGVPAHDERDFEFAKKYGLPISDAALVSFEEGMAKGGGQKVVRYKLRDWVFSRQRYWGEPIPMIWCPHCAKASRGKDNAGWQPVSEEELPVKLPEVDKYQPTATGESPLAAITDWVNTECPQCGGPARRETDTMPNWAGSSWYYLAYVVQDSKTKTYNLKTKTSLEYWLPVDWYNGGMEHTTLHLLYSRFWHKFLFDLGLVPTSEPYRKRTSHGLILAEGGVKMSKSKGNVVNPDEIVERYGADTLRLYEMFLGPFDQAISWSADGLMGPRRFLEKVWKLGLVLSVKDFFRSSETIPRPFKNPSLTSLLHQTIKKVTEDIEAMRFNTAVSALMILVNKMEASATVTLADYQTLLQLLAPFAPHLTEELWVGLGERESVHRSPWPEFDPARLQSETITVTIQVNGVTRGTLAAPTGAAQTEIEAAARREPRVAKHLAHKTVKKIIFIPDKVINFVV